MKKSLLAFGILTTGCATNSTVTLESNTVSEVYEIDMSDPTGEWQKVGQTPYRAELETGKVVIYRITGEGGKSKYLLFPTVLPDGQLTLNFDLVGQGIFQPDKQKPEEAQPNQTETLTNQQIREINQSILTILKAYAALWEQKPESAKELAQEAESQFKNLVGPPLIEALAAFMENNIQEAQAKIAIAKSRQGTEAAIIKEIEEKISLPQP